MDSVLDYRPIMKIELTTEEANYIAGLLGRQPIESGAAILWAKVRNQIAEQSQPVEQAEEPQPKAKAK